MNDKKMTGMELRATWGLSAVFSLRMLGMFMVLPVLTTYGMALQGANEALIGLAIGIYGLAQAVFQIPLGLMSDRVGRKQIIVGGLFIFALGSTIPILTNSIWGVILARAIQGSSAIAAVAMALLSDLTREQNRTKAMAFIGISFGVTFGISMVLGPIITHAIGLKGLFCCITALTVVGIALTLLVVPTAGAHKLNRESSIVYESFGKVLANPQLLKLSIGIFFLHSILMSNFVAFPSMMARAGFLPNEQWKVYFVTILVSFTAVVPVIIYAEAKRRMKHVFLSCVTLLLLAELVLLATNGHLWVIFTGIQMFFLAFNIMEALLPSLISKESPAGYKGTAMGIYSTSQFLGIAFGGILGGFLFQLENNWLVFLANSTITLAWWLISITLREPPYVSSLRISLPGHMAIDSQLAQSLQALPGVTEVIIVPEECSAYIKVDIKQTNRAALEKIVTA
ncbi:MAG: MFS transporter [Sodalis sp. (in: enterobacteria)]